MDKYFYINVLLREKTYEEQVKNCGFESERKWTITCYSILFSIWELKNSCILSKLNLPPLDYWTCKDCVWKQFLRYLLKTSFFLINLLPCFWLCFYVFPSFTITSVWIVLLVWSFGCMLTTPWMQFSTWHLWDKSLALQSKYYFHQCTIFLGAETWFSIGLMLLSHD